MRLFKRSILFIILIMSFAACKRNLEPSTIPAHITVGNTYYTQFVIRYEKNAHLTTNYRRGGSIPVNTSVKLLEITKRIMNIEIEGSGQPILIKNVEKHTGDDVLKAFDKYFSKDKVNLSQFSRSERKNIKEGTVKKGMSKKAVTTAIGYPPITETYSIDADTWVYWSHRYNKFNVNFKKGKVSSVID